MPSAGARLALAVTFLDVAAFLGRRVECLIPVLLHVMARKGSRYNPSRPRAIELLEDRCVMAADPISLLTGGTVEQHALAEPPALVRHGMSDADFWIDPVAERDLDALMGELEQYLTNADAVTGLSYVRNNYGFTGVGQTVAVIDSGIAWDHVALGGGLGSSYRVVGGWDFAENDANPYDDGIYGSHGTHVSGIVGGERAGVTNDGVAPGVDFVGLRVFNDAGQGYFHWVENALQWVYQNRNTFENPITTVNLSLGTSWNATTVPNWTTLEDEFAQLKSVGIFISVSAGNSFTSYNTPGLSYPAASPHVVPVMAMDDNGSLSYFSQRHSRAIAAPGRGIVSSIPDYAGNHNGIADDYGSMSGTSMAAPYIAGASVLIREAMQSVGYVSITQDTIYNHMLATATTVFDAATNQTYKRINLANAIDTLMAADGGGSAVAATDWGTVTQLQSNNVSNSGTTWYQIRASQTGYLTAEAFFAAAGGNIDISLHNAGQQLLASGKVISGGERAELYVTASADYYLRVVGTNADVDFRITNLLSKVGGTVTVSGTSGADVFTFTAGAKQHTVGVNGVTYQFAKTAATVFNVNGGAGSDSITMTGTTKAEAAEIRVGNASLKGAGFQVTVVGVENVAVNSGGGKDSVKLYDSAGNDLLNIHSDRATLAGSGYSHTANGFKIVAAFASSGSDTAHLYDTARNDTFRANVGYVEMKGSGYVNSATGFDTTHGHASAGSDKAYFYDSAGNDTYEAHVQLATMTGAGYSNTGSGFDKTYAYASIGFDVAHLYDSAGYDVYKSWSNRATMTGAGFSNAVYNFDSMLGHATVGTDSIRTYGLGGEEGSRPVREENDRFSQTFGMAAQGIVLTGTIGAPAVNRASIAATSPSAATEHFVWDDYVTASARKKEAFGSDEVEFSSIADDDPSATLDTLDQLFTSLNELS